MIFRALIFFLSFLFVHAAQATTLNIMKDAETKEQFEARCQKSQERTEQLLKLVSNRLDYEVKRNKHHQDELAKRSEDERASYLNAIIIDRSQAMTDIEGFLDKVSRRLELVSGNNICTGIADTSNKQYAFQLREASRKLQDEYAWLEKKVQPATND